MPDAPSGSEAGSDAPFTFNQVLLDELNKLRPDVKEFQTLQAEALDDPFNPDASEFVRGQNLREIYQHIGALSGPDRLTALCLSGGGIRSATFNLGVIQGLTRLRLLDQFDYLSTVSGGGYIGGWLKAWMRRDGTARVLNELNNTIPELPLKPEPRPVDRLREYSNYLTPRRGLLSGDSWSAGAIVIRNLLLNWLVALPVLMAVIALPQLYYLALQLQDGSRRAPVAIGLAIILGLTASIAIHRFRHPRDRRGTPESKVVAGGVLPLVLSALLLSLGVSWLPPENISAFQVIVFALLWCVLLPLAGWSLREPFHRLDLERRLPWREGLAMVLSGSFSALLLVLLSTSVFRYLEQRPLLYALAGVPILLGIYLLSRSLFVGLAEAMPRPEQASEQTTAKHPGAREDADREWWARLSGYVLLGALAWLVINAIALLGWHFATRYARDYVMQAAGGVGVVSGVVALVLGKGSSTSSGHESAGHSKPSRWKLWSLHTAAPLFCAISILMLAQMNTVFGRALTGNAALFEIPPSMLRFETAHVPDASLLIFFAMALTLLLFGFLMGRAVNVNYFSLHGMYRNRLVRAFLGASNPKRKPDPFTGFALNDNIKMADLWKAPVHVGDLDSRKPMHIVNTTLNLVRGARLGWQERKAESFSISPFYCGNFYEGYRRTSEYGGPGGITLGTALTISGAAANPNMGYHSSPPITFLLGILNGRLGAWLGNTNVNGALTYRHQGPRWAVRPLFAELFGLTSSTTKYVQLSDGGHFDNLGLYEMVLRRCRLIVVCDAGRDPTSGFEDLGNVIRKIRIDFGISIEFETPIKIVPRTEKDSGLYCALGSIKYSEVDGTLAGDGTVIYLKPTLNALGAALPYDVFSYSRMSGDFPHESTVDQWFDESQFESYRALGRHLVAQITARDRNSIRTLFDFQNAVQHYMEGVRGVTPTRQPVMGEALTL